MQFLPGTPDFIDRFAADVQVQLYLSEQVLGKVGSASGAADGGTGASGKAALLSQLWFEVLPYNRFSSMPMFCEFTRLVADRQSLAHLLPLAPATVSQLRSPQRLPRWCPFRD